MNTLTVEDLCILLDDLAPWPLTEKWDNTGLMVGNPKAAVSSILIALDPTPQLLAEASATGADVIITHHPLIFHPLKSLQTTAPGGRVVAEAVKKDISIIACHTNLDAATGGVNDILADGLGMQNRRPLLEAHEESHCGLGRIGEYDPPVDAQELVNRLRKLCSPPWLLAAGPRPKRISCFAVCGGSCSDMVETAVKQGAQVFITSEVKHAAARYAEEAGIWLIDGGHFATEYPAMKILASNLIEKLHKTGCEPHVAVSRQYAPVTLLE